MGRRVKKSVYSYNSDSWLLTSEFFFIYDGWNLVEEITEAGAAQSSRYFVWGQDLSQSLQGAGGIGGLIATVDGAADYLYCFDANGNVGQVVNAADGSIAAKYEYDPYGKPIKADGAYAADNPYRFSTKYHDDETELVYYGYRYYSAELGRWVSRDPINEKGGLNLYIFVQNDPLIKYDFLGLYIEKNEEDYKFTAKNGIRAHKLIMSYVDNRFNGEPINEITSTKWELEFDQSLNILSLGFSDRRPDIISKTTCKKLIWEIKPITHINRFDWLEKDYDQIDDYLSLLTDKSYEYGEAKTFFPMSNLPIGIIKGDNDNLYKVRVISNHNRDGLIFYDLEKVWENDDLFKQVTEEFAKGPNPWLYWLLFGLMGGSGVPGPAF